MQVCKLLTLPRNNSREANSRREGQTSWQRSLASREHPRLGHLSHPTSWVMWKKTRWTSAPKVGKGHCHASLVCDSNGATEGPASASNKCACMERLPTNEISEAKLPVFRALNTQEWLHVKRRTASGCSHGYCQMSERANQLVTVYKRREVDGVIHRGVALLRCYALL